MKSLGSTLGRLDYLGPLFLRLGVGTVFAVHGWQKFDGGVSNFAKVLTSLDVPAPEIVAWLQTMAEGLGGLLLIIGLMTRFVTLPLIATMIGAILLVKVNVGFVVSGRAGAELDTALLAGLLCLLFIGPGRISLDAKLGVESGTARLGSGRRSSVDA
jgi:putative oxidoreductase